jgi:hypothetical protein
MAINVSQVKLLRQSLNKIETGIEQLTPSREVALSKTNLQECIMFLGLVLGDIGEETPYVKTNDVKTQHIDPRADLTDMPFNFDATDHIGRVKELREDIQKKITDLKAQYLAAHDTVVAPEKKPFFPANMVSALTSLTKARLWLGMELGEVKKRADKALVESDSKSATLKKAPAKKSKK